MPEGGRKFEGDVQMRYDDLHLVVRNHVDNLKAQLEQFMRKYGKKNLKELTTMVTTDEMSLEDAKKYSAISKAMTEAFENNRLPKEMEKTAKALRETALLRCKDAEKVYEDHLVQDDLQTLYRKERVRVFGVCLRLKRENDIKNIIINTFTVYEHAAAFAGAGDFSLALRLLGTIDRGGGWKTNALEVLRHAINQENDEVVEQLLSYCKPDSPLDTLIERSVRKLIQRKEFNRAKNLVQYVLSAEKKSRILRSIARGEIKAGKNWNETIRQAEAALPVLKDFSGVLVRDRGEVDLAVFYAEQGSVDDALRTFHNIQIDLRTKHIVRFVRALVSSGHDQEAEEIVANLESSVLNNISQIQAYAMIAVTQAEHGRNSDAAMHQATSNLKLPQHRVWLSNLRVTPYLAYAHLMRGELKEMSDLLDQTNLSNTHTSSLTDRRDLINLFEDFIRDCQRRKVDIERLLKMMEKIICNNPNQDELFDTLVDFAHTVKTAGKDPTPTLNQARFINSKDENKTDVYGFLELADTHQELGMESSPVYDDAILFAEHQEISVAFGMLEDIASHKIKKGLDFSDVTQAAYRFTSGREMRDNPQKVWTLWYAFQMQVSAALIDKAEEIERGLI